MAEKESSSQTTTDHEEIRQRAEARGGTAEGEVSRFNKFVRR